MKLRRRKLPNVNIDISTVGYFGGFAALVTAGFLYTIVVGFVVLGASLLTIGYMAEED